MAKLTIRYFTKRPGKNGTKRYFWQPSKELADAGWKLTRLPDNYTDAVAEAQRINAAVDEWRAGLIKSPVTERPGTLSALWANYKNSRFWRDLSPKTQYLYGLNWKTIEAWAGDAPVKSITAKSVQIFYEKLLATGKPAKAGTIIRTLRLLMTHAERENWIPKGSNPAANPGIKYKAKRQEIWSEDDVTAFVAQADKMDHFGVGTAVLINAWMGQRKMDLLSLSVKDYRDGVIQIRQSKTGANVDLPVDLIPQLKERIAAQIERNRKHSLVGTLIQDSKGRPYTEYTFTHIVQDIREQAQKHHPTLKGKTFKNLRHTAVVRLAEAGAEVTRITSVSGHSLGSANQILEVYNVRTKKAAQEAFKLRLQHEENQTEKGK